jgi:two-component system sensor histidine kinase YesM
MIHNNRISYALNIDPGLLGVKIVKLVLQPLLENAIIHGVKHGEDLHLNIKAERAGDNMKIDVSDDGIGIIQEKLDGFRSAFRTGDWSALPDAYGLRNVHERIRLHYGEPYGLSVESVFDQGTTAAILIPIGRE